MAPKKKSPSKTVVKAKPKTGKKGAASVFPKDKGGRTWSENDRGLPSSGHEKRRPPKRPISAAAKKSLKRLSKDSFGSAAPKPAAKRACPGCGVALTSDEEPYRGTDSTGTRWSGSSSRRAACACSCRGRSGCLYYCVWRCCPRWRSRGCSRCCSSGSGREVPSFCNDFLACNLSH